MHRRRVCDTGIPAQRGEACAPRTPRGLTYTDALLVQGQRS